MSTRYVRAEDTPLITETEQGGAPVAKAGASKKKLYLIIGGAVFVVFILIIVVVLAVGGGNKNIDVPVDPVATLAPTVGIPPDRETPTPTITPTSGPVPTLEPTPTKKPGKIPINGVVVNDFNQFAQGKLPNGDVLIVRNEKYQIIYLTSSRAFSITILVEDFLNTRGDAEKEFIRLLDITPESACSLSVTIGSPSHINSRYAGLSFPMSNCEQSN